MSLSYRNHPIALTLTASFLISLLLLLFFGFGKAHADVSNVWPTEPAEATYYCRPASGICPGAFGNSPMYLTVGAGEFNNNVSYTKVYAFGTNYTVNIIEGTICNSTISDGYYASQPPDIYNSAYSTRFDFTDRFGNLLSSQTLGYDCANRNRTYNIGLPAGSFNPVTGRYEGYIIGSMVSPTPWTNENSFRYTFAGAEAGPGNLYGNATFSFSNRNIPSNYVHNMSVVFAPNCTMPQTGNGTIQIYDVDQGIYQGTGSYPNLTWEAYARPRELTGGGGR